MNNEKEQYPDLKPQIQTLFQKLTELILSSAATRADVANLIGAVGNWVAVMLASLIVMIEGKNQDKAFIVADRIAATIAKDIKKHVIMLRGLQNKKEESSITLPDSYNRGKS